MPRSWPAERLLVCKLAPGLAGGKNYCWTTPAARDTFKDPTQPTVCICVYICVCVTTLIMHPPRPPDSKHFFHSSNLEANLFPSLLLKLNFGAVVRKVIFEALLIERKNI